MVTYVHISQRARSLQSQLGANKNMHLCYLSMDEAGQKSVLKSERFFRLKINKMVCLAEGQSVGKSGGRCVSEVAIDNSELLALA